jgi:hypothetical protein
MAMAGRAMVDRAMEVGMMGRGSSLQEEEEGQDPMRRQFSWET